MADFWESMLDGGKAAGYKNLRKATDKAVYDFDPAQLSGRTPEALGDGSFVIYAKDGTPLIVNPRYTGGGMSGVGENAAPVAPTLEGWQVAKSVNTGGGWMGAGHNSKYNGVDYDLYDRGGQFLGGGQYDGIKDGGTAPGAFLGMFAGGVGATLAGMGGAAASAVGEGVGNAGGFVGEGAASGIPSWDAAAGLGGEAVGNAGGFIGEGVASGVPGWDVAAGVAPGAAAGGGGGGLMQAVTQKLGAGTVASLLGSGSTLETIAKIAGVAAPIVGGALTSNAAGNAADAQLQATREAAALQEPFRQGGMKGLNRLLDLYGLSGNTGAQGYGSAMKKFGMEDFHADPGFQFRQSEGEKALQRSASARGMLGSGEFMKDAMRFNQGIASDEYGKSYDRYGTDIARMINPLQALAGQGQSSANTIGEYKLQGGNAEAAGKVGQANAWGNAIGQGISMYQNNQQRNDNNLLMQQLLRR